MTVLATFARLCVPDLDAALDELAASGCGDVRLRFGHASGLQLALVSGLLVLAGTDDQLAPFRATSATVIVTDLDAALGAATGAGAVVVRGIAQQQTGRNATVRLAGGPVLEFVEWDDATRRAAGLT